MMRNREHSKSNLTNKNVFIEICPKWLKFRNDRVWRPRCKRMWITSTSLLSHTYTKLLVLCFWKWIAVGMNKLHPCWGRDGGLGGIKGMELPFEWLQNDAPSRAQTRNNSFICWRLEGKTHFALLEGHRCNSLQLNPNLSHKMTQFTKLGRF